MIEAGECFRTASRLDPRMKKLMLERLLSRERTKNKELSTLSDAVQESWCATQLETVDYTNLAAVKIAVNQDGLMDITTITLSQWLSDGYATHATDNGTQNTDKD